MSASNNFITRPVLTTVCSLVIVILGLISIPILPIENLPDIAPPTVTVTSAYVGADAVTVEEGVTAVLEQDINGVQDMEFMTSNSSSDGVSTNTWQQLVRVLIPRAKKHRFRSCMGCW